MSHIRCLYFGIVLLAIALLILQPVRHRIASAQAQADPFRAVYDHDEHFNQLSGAARTLLESRFGKKAKPAKTVAGPEETKGPSQASGVAQPSEALANNLVNDPFADATAQDTQSETTAVVAGSTLVCGFNDSGSYVTSNHFTGFAQSTDTGTSWADKGLLPTSTNGDAGDPVLARDNVSGTIYFATLFFSGSGIQVFRSFDSGASFSAPVNGAPGKSGLQDKEWIAVDNAAGVGQGNVYLVERDFGAGNGVYLFRSTDGGDTYGPSGGVLIASAASGNVQGAWVTVGPDHSVYALWYDAGVSPAQIRVRKSTDRGVTFGAAVTVTTLVSVGINGDLGLGFRSNCFPQAAVNPANGDVYVVYNDLGGGTDRGNIFFRQSTDGGANWSAAAQVNTDATTRAQFMPSLAVTPDGSALAITWYDRRRDPADALIERWGVTASVSGATLTFTSNFRVSNAQFPAVYGVDPVVNSSYMGDYDHMASDNVFFYTTWGDNRDQSIAVPSRKNANVRFAKIPVAGPGPILDFASSTVSGGNGNGRIDANECNDLTVAVMNNGSAPATGVSVTLSTTTPGVTLRNSTQSYPDINPGQTAENAAPFQVSTSPTIPCPSTITFSVVASYSGGSDVSTFTLAVAGANYIISSSTGTSIVPGTTDVGNHGDDVTTVVALPFSYQLYGASFASVTVSSNGNLQFASNSTAYANSCLPTPSFSMSVLANWDDLITSGVGGGIFTSISGSAPNRIFNIEWRTNYYGTTQVANFEVRLHEGQSRFDIVYGQMDQGGSSATVGVQKDTGSAFTQFACNTAGSLTAGLQLSFSLPPCATGSGECAGCAISCPANISASNEAGLCGAVVNYPDPTATPECGTVTCSPASGSFFPVGTTSVTCATAAGPSCSFGVTVLEAEPPTITCVNINVTTKGNKCVAVTFNPTVGDNCTAPDQIVVACTPPTGFCFPIGTTTVSCTATDVSGNTSTCAFNVTVVKQKGKP